MILHEDVCQHMSPTACYRMLSTAASSLIQPPATDTLSRARWDKVMSDSHVLAVQQSDINGRLQTQSDVPRSRRLVTGSIMRVMMY